MKKIRYLAYHIVINLFAFNFLIFMLYLYTIILLTYFRMIYIYIYSFFLVLIVSCERQSLKNDDSLLFSIYHLTHDTILLMAYRIEI